MARSPPALPLPPVLVTLSIPHVSKATAAPRQSLPLPCTACPGLPLPISAPPQPRGPSWWQMPGWHQGKGLHSREQVTIL